MKGKKEKAAKQAEKVRFGILLWGNSLALCFSALPRQALLLNSCVAAGQQL